MVAYYRDYPHPDQFSPQPVAKLDTAEKSPQAVAKLQSEDSLLWSVPWGHHVPLMTKVKDAGIRRCYMEQTLANGWSRNVLTLMIESEAHRRTGKLNFYCNVVNDQLRHERDHPTIGLILCQIKDNVQAEYRLTGIDEPIGVSSYELTRALPKSLQSALLTVEQIEAELSTPDTAKKRKGKKRKND